VSLRSIIEPPNKSLLLARKPEKNLTDDTHLRTNKSSGFTLIRLGTIDKGFKKAKEFFMKQKMEIEKSKLMILRDSPPSVIEFDCLLNLDSFLNESQVPNAMVKKS